MCTNDIRETLKGIEKEADRIEEFAYEADLKLDKARAILRMIIQGYRFDNAEPSNADKIYIAESIPTIYTLMESADDFLLEISKSLKEVLA